MHRRAAEFTSRVRERYDLDLAVEEFPEGTKTAADAAEAVGCEVGQIASSLVFDADGDLVVVVTSGANRVDESLLAERLGAEDVAMADPERISEVVGWSIGGVPPLCHETDVPVYIDESLLDHERVWAAAGTPTAVFPIDPVELRRIAGATPIGV
ncbi:YbaK/EbsC family protein [Halobellus limi]|uniref:Cys-tRNA(Pro) deacylase, prolyl-tRNA editing enzyme YbaK/EbsC n=1 Tax=Halobellus limi TaxID=699433 RepID=A0A1H6AT07_9EURY|nr:YbaK/EbsC family protein [Halobellus limi]QCC48914.1 YbaK/EbsC family protein [Halobellus limi]SEG50966.1 Cys-tRNA(Pro) deacylase, prolyl-tRNA editing enzyme YbaK/EbsC [Halobellus limi]